MKFVLRKFNTSTLGGLIIHFLLAISVMALLGILYFFAYLPNVTNHGETITVPSIEGKSISEAEEFLASHDLRIEVNDSSYSADYPPLTVLKQYPSVGAKVKENRKIFITINRVSAPTVPLPDLVNNSSLAGAEALLKTNELKLGHIEFRSSPFLNLVLDMKYKGKQITSGMRIPKGTAIDLVVGDGGLKDYEMPDILGESIEDAKVLIFGSYLNIGDITLVGDTLDMQPVVLKQKPEPNENIRAGDVVDIWVGKEGTPVPEDDEEPDGHER